MERNVWLGFDLVLGPEFWQCICQALSVRLEAPVPRMTHADAMEAYGTDRPDLRYGLKMATVSQAVKDSTFRSHHLPLIKLPKLSSALLRE